MRGTVAFLGKKRVCDGITKIQWLIMPYREVEIFWKYRDEMKMEGEGSE